MSLDTEPVLDLTLGTTVPIPFRASFNVSGSPQGSMSTFQDLRFVYPAVHSLDTIKYEISPYNYILYLNPVVGGINGTTTIRNSMFNNTTHNSKYPCTITCMYMHTCTYIQICKFVWFNCPPFLLIVEVASWAVNFTVNIIGKLY